MKIVADQDIFAVAPVFRQLGDLVLRPGRQISRRDLVDADALLVRSVLNVDRSLLAGTRVGFVGAATSGIDHIDAGWLDENGIKLAHARGANARAVVEYCLGAIASLTLAGVIAATKPRIGVIGAGAIGGSLARQLLALGHDVVVCDPPLAEAGIVREEYAWQALSAALDCDIVSLHVPLDFAGKHATAGLIGAGELARLPPGAVLINASRAGVVDEDALLARLRTGPALHCVVDVWKNEPGINAELVRAASLATPHIAGYSEQAKWKATLVLARQLAVYSGVAETTPDDSAGAGAGLAVKPDRANDGLGHWRILDQCLGLAGLSSRFRSWAAAAGKLSDADRIAREFDELRRPCLGRQEFSAINLGGTERLPTSQRHWLQQAGFRLQPPR